ncbi:hypothetical protein [Noviherbaspirillum sp.]|uniref:hypothetical protein n=1 Tax=Noviherbaspirillum sp. TaxID=1926288 RepID=UPI002B4886B7|nr:hypothetical protein [Noviherbaspirillum sp.]
MIKKNRLSTEDAEDTEIFMSVRRALSGESVEQTGSFSVFFVFSVDNKSRQQDAAG